MGKNLKFIFLILFILVLGIGIYLVSGRNKELVEPLEKGGEPTKMEQVGELKLTSSAFEDQAYIPARYTCEGDDINPSLYIENVPGGTKSLALVVDDPDAPAGVWDHWIVWNIPAETTQIPEGTVPEGALQGTNDSGNLDYGGPCPPAGSPHRYQFKLYALDTKLDLTEGASKDQLEQAMTGHILAQTQLTGLYQR